MGLPSDFARADRPRTALRRHRSRAGRPGAGPIHRASTALDPTPRRAPTPPDSRPGPARRYRPVNTEWIGDVDNGLDADFQWLYNDGPDSGVPGCSGSTTSGCWADRRSSSAGSAHAHLVMGAAFDPTGDTSGQDRGGSSLAATLGHHLPCRPVRLHMEAGTGRDVRRDAPASAGDPRLGVRYRDRGPDPQRVAGARLHALRRHRDRQLPYVHRFRPWRHQPRPRTRRDPADGAAGGLRPAEHARSALRRGQPREGGSGLPAFGGLTSALDRNAQKGADDANDPPDPGQAYDLDDAEWAGGSSNGLDAVYGWMYDDGFDSGNLDCPHRRPRLLGPPQRASSTTSARAPTW